MPKGGARARSGPAPDPEALRRDIDGHKWTVLPSARSGPVPDWPLADQTVREKVLWAREWKRPQAVMWERNGQAEEVAMYVRSLAAAERHDSSVAARTLVRQQQDSLGLSLPGLARFRWRIGEHGPQAAPKPAAEPIKSVRERFKVVDGGRSA